MPPGALFFLELATRHSATIFFRIRTYRRSPRFSRYRPKSSASKSFRIRTYKICAYNSFRIRTYEKTGGGGALMLTTTSSTSTTSTGLACVPATTATTFAAAARPHRSLPPYLPMSLLLLRPSVLSILSNTFSI
jgi:hypothetical protein